MVELEKKLKKEKAFSVNIFYVVNLLIAPLHRLI